MSDIESYLGGLPPDIADMVRRHYAMTRTNAEQGITETRNWKQGPLQPMPVVELPAVQMQPQGPTQRPHQFYDTGADIAQLIHQRKQQGAYEPVRFNEISASPAEYSLEIGEPQIEGQYSIEVGEPTIQANGPNTQIKQQKRRAALAAMRGQ